ncbi:hypothetical protein [Facklamia miroungae]|uniref:Uncharacterized protein n=1 Tax=Facklamia miroungae TaxID=120956 RepID=A0A1G7RVB3_9LACT|nr:hypothetical protein [Facklamia miroungae]NKZ29259.1 hypothetical protein [Facklamia miroungae]SDG14757.1 hypothetical protein SAMN05421791_103196 [Facklamia miroungae]
MNEFVFSTILILVYLIHLFSKRNKILFKSKRSIFNRITIIILSCVFLFSFWNTVDHQLLLSIVCLLIGYAVSIEGISKTNIIKFGTFDNKIGDYEEISIYEKAPKDIYVEFYNLKTNKQSRLILNESIQTFEKWIQSNYPDILIRKNE